MNIGSGSHTYEWIGDWAKLPAGKELGYTHGVVVDSKDNVYIFNTGKNPLLTFDKDGNFIRSWGEKYSGAAHGLFLSKESDGEYLWLIDHDLKTSTKYTLDGKQLLELKVPPRTDLYPTDANFKPTDVCVAPNGDIYVFDGYGTPLIHQYDKAGKYIRTIGKPGSGAGELNCPHGGWIDTRHGEPELYVADRGNNRIQVFTLDGKHKRFITDEMQQPCCFYQWKDEQYIPDLQARVTILDKNDKLIAHLGSNPEAPKTPGWPNIQDKLQPGKFNSPHAACVDSRGDVYVVEWISTGRITKLKRK